MTQPQRDHGLIDTMVEQVHRGAVAQGMRRDPLCADARTGARCSQAMLAYQMFERIPAEPFATDRREQWSIAVAMIPDPYFQDLGGFPPDRCGPFLSSLPYASDVSAGAEHNIPVSQADQL